MDAPKEFNPDTFKPKPSFREVMASTKPLEIVLAKAPVIEQTVTLSGTKGIYSSPLALQSNYSVEQNDRIDSGQARMTEKIIRTPEQVQVGNLENVIARRESPADSRAKQSIHPEIATDSLSPRNDVVEDKSGMMTQVVEEVQDHPKRVTLKERIPDPIKQMRLEELLAPEKVYELVKVPAVDQAKSETDVVVKRETELDLEMGQEVVTQLTKAGIELEEALETVQDSLVRKGIEVVDITTLIPAEIKINPQVVVQKLVERRIIQEVNKEDEEEEIDNQIRASNITSLRTFRSSQKSALKSNRYYFIVDERARRLRYEALKAAIKQAFKEKDMITGLDILAFMKSDKSFNSAIKLQGPDGLWFKAQEYIEGLERIESIDQALRIVEWVLDVFPGVDTDTKPKNTVGDWAVEGVLRGDKEFYLTPEQYQVRIIKKLPQEYLLARAA